MRRDGHIIEEITERRNLEEAFDTVVRGRERKRLAEGKWLLAHREEFLDSVAEEIEGGHIDLGAWHPKDIFEAGKLRHIQVFSMKTRIKVGAVMAVVDRHLRGRYIRTTSASIKGRGMHDLKKQIERDLRKPDSEIRYWYKFDIRKFYDTVRQEEVKRCVRRVFKDRRLTAILDQFIEVLPVGVGMSMGMRSSQGLCNLLLSYALDHELKERLGVRHFYRYCDDGLAGVATKREAWRVREAVHERIAAIGQEVKRGDRVFPIEEGVDFLGYVIYPTHTLLRKRVKKNVARKLGEVKSRKRREKVIGSFYGMAKHADSRHLMKQLLTEKEMRKFSEMGITYTPADGKKRFAGNVKRLGEIVNEEIEIHDFERDVRTKHGDKRYLVSYRDKRTGEYGKFFTNSEELKAQLEQADAMDEGFPFETVIRSEVFTVEGERKFKYKFT